MRRIWAITVTLVALLLIAVQPAAAAPPIHQPGEYFQYDGWASMVDDRMEVDVSVSIHNSRDVLQLHVTRVTYALRHGNARLVSEEFGTAYPDPALLIVDDLSVVTLEPTFRIFGFRPLWVERMGHTPAGDSGCAMGEPARRQHPFGPCASRRR